MNRSDVITKIFTSLRDFNKSSRQAGGEEKSLISAALDNVLATIGSDETINIKLLAQVLTITSGAATQHVLALEKEGYVKRQPNPIDRRETFVSLTPKGKIARKEALRIQTEVAEAVFARLSDAEMNQLVRIIEKITLTETEGK